MVPKSLKSLSRSPRNAKPILSNRSVCNTRRKRCNACCFAPSSPDAPNPAPSTAPSHFPASLDGVVAAAAAEPRVRAACTVPGETAAGCGEEVLWIQWRSKIKSSAGNATCRMLVRNDTPFLNDGRHSESRPTTYSFCSPKVRAVHGTLPARDNTESIACAACATVCIEPTKMMLSARCAGTRHGSSVRTSRAVSPPPPRVPPAAPTAPVPAISPSATSTGMLPSCSIPLASSTATER